MQKKRLLKIADFLENYVKDDWFDIGEWATEGFTEKKCGSAGCILGWTPSCFPRSGFKLEKDFYLNTYFPVYKDYTDFCAGAEFYGLTTSQAYYLFSPDYYQDDDKQSRLDVVKRIREFVESNGETAKADH